MISKTNKAAEEATLATATDPSPSRAKVAKGALRPKPPKTPGKGEKSRKKPAVADTDAKTKRTPRTNTKQAQLIAMLQAKDGATIEDIAAALGWQTHTVRGALYGALKKRLGLDVVSEKVEGRGRVYRIGS